MHIKRPWPIYVIAVLFIFFIESFVTHEAFKLFGIEDIKSKQARLLRLIVFSGIVFISFYFYKLEKWAGDVIAALFALQGASWAYSLFMALYAGITIPSPTNISLPIVTIICFLIPWYLLRPKLWEKLEPLQTKLEKAKKQKEADKLLLK